MDILTVILVGATLGGATPLPAHLSNQTTVVFDVNNTAAEASPLNKQLMSLSIEFDASVAYFGDVGKPNTFSKQLLQNVAERAGVPTVLRIGGNTQDRADFCAECENTIKTIANTDPNDPKQSEALFVEYNSGLFKVLQENVPAGTPIIFGLNFRNGSYNIAQTEVDAASKYFDPSILMAYELGNEPNFYPPVFRPEGWNAEDYGEGMQDWIPRLQNRTEENTAWMFGAFAGPPNLFDDGLTVANLVELGVPQSIPNIKYYSTHGYPYEICSNQTAALVNLTNFLDHDKTVELVGHYANESAAAKSVGGILHMGETGTVACHGKEGVSNTLGAALWELDYAMTGAVSGFDRFMFHNGQGDYYYSMWEPIGTELHPGAHIYPTYYAMLFIADLVGDLEDPSISALPGLDTTSTVHFAIFDCGQLSKLVLLNLAFFDGSYPRSSESYDLTSILGSELEVRRLTASSSAAQGGVTWAGQQVDDDGLVIDALNIERVSDGVVTVLGSEAVIVEAAKH